MIVSTKPSEYVTELKNAMAKAANEVNLKSLFLIGSCSGDALSDEWYQDYDIHFLFDEIFIPTDKLNWLRELLKNSALKSNQDCKIEWFVKDRHWKMIPQATYPINIGLHATLLNAADHFRRLHYNPILAANMYGRCNVLHGNHPAEIRGKRPPVILDYLHSVGGIGWLAENFARVVALYQLDQKDHTFYPFIAGYCWNIASSLMFHIYTLTQGGLSGRKHALEYFLNIEDVQNNLVLSEAALLLYKNRENPGDEANFSKPLIDAVGLIINYAKDRILLNLPNFNTSSFDQKLFTHRELYSEVMKKMIERNYQCAVVDIFRNEDLSYYDSIYNALESIKHKHGNNISPKENFEFARDILISNKKLIKIRIWDSISCFRLIYSHDFDIPNGVNSKESVLFNWEDGFQTLLQRLNEIYIEKSGRIDSELERLCEFINLLIDQRLNFLSINFQNGEACNDFNKTRLRLSHILESSCPKSI